jgi:uncharacterized membrane protein YhaH (DUF805 family)
MIKTPFSYDGRIRRTEFCLSVLIYDFLVVIVSLAMEGGTMPALVAFAAIVPSMWFLTAQAAKRCHDRGNSGWYQLLPGYFLILMFGKGDSGINEFGQDPKALIEQAEDAI